MIFAGRMPFAACRMAGRQEGVAHCSAHSYPRRTGLRTETSIIAETAQAFSTHHIAVLVGYGAHAVVPYLAFETCRQWRAAPRCALHAARPGACATSDDAAWLVQALWRFMRCTVVRRAAAVLEATNGGSGFAVVRSAAAVLRATSLH